MDTRSKNSYNKYINSPSYKASEKTYTSWVKKQQKLNKTRLGNRSLEELKIALKDTFNRQFPNVYRRDTIRKENLVKSITKTKKLFLTPMQDHYKELSDMRIQSWTEGSAEVLKLRQQESETYIAGLNKHLENLKKTYTNRFTTLDQDESVVRELGLDSIDYIKNKNQIAIDKLKGRYEAVTSNIDHINNLLKRKGINVNPDTESVLKALEESNDVKLMKAAAPFLTNKAVSVINPNKVKANTINKEAVRFKQGDQDKLVKYFIENMGNNVEDAERKAAMFFKRGNGSDIFINQGIISFTDRVSDKKVSIPLTSYNKDGIRYHDTGNGSAKVVKQFNPYANIYRTGREIDIDRNGTFRKVTVQDMLKGYDPEMMLEHLGDDQAISGKLVDKIKSLFSYNSDETGVEEFFSGQDFKPKSAKFENSQGVISIDDVLAQDINGKTKENPFEKISRISRERNSRSDLEDFYSKFSVEANPNVVASIRDNISNNDLSSYNTKGYQTLAPFAPNTRNDSDVGNRSNKIVDKTRRTRALETLMGKDFNRQFSSAQVLNKLDVTNVDDFNRLMSSLYSSDKALGDGSGLYNGSASKNFVTQERATINIIDDAAISHEGLKSILEQGGDLSENLRLNNIDIDNKVLGFNPDGSPLKLNNMYSGGKIVGATKDTVNGRERLQLHVDAIFDPSVSENSIKLFSVSSKSLQTSLTEDQHITALGIGSLLNSNAVVPSANASQKELEAFQKIAYAEGFRLNQISNIDVIQRSADTGTADIIKLLRGKEEDIGLRFEEMKLNTKTSGYDEILKMNPNADKKAAALTAYMLSNNKASTDLVAQVTTNQIIRAEAKGNSNLGSIITTIREAFKADNLLNPKTRQKTLQNAYEIVHTSGETANVTKGITTSTASFNKGRSIVGAGNKARLSWVAKYQMLMSGFDRKDLEIFGKQNKSLLYEVNSSITENSVAKEAINKVIKGKEGSFLGVINKTPEERMKAFNQMFDVDFTDKAYLTYNLNYEKSNLKSINFSRLSTSRSGNYDTELITLTKDLDKYKQKVFINDLKLASETDFVKRKAREVELLESIKDYQEHVGKMYSGENNLAKAVNALESDTSQIMEVKPIAGQAEQYLESLKPNKESRVITNKWFISQESAEYKANMLGIDKLEYQDIEGFDRLKRAGYRDANNKFIPLADLLTREPAQGPLSTDLVEYLVDTSIEKGSRDTIYTTNSNFLYANLQFGDMDQDTVHTLSGKFNTLEEYQLLQSKREDIRNVAIEMQDLIDSMKVKGKSSSLKNIGDFLEEAGGDHNTAKKLFGEYRMAEGAQGRNRKLLAAPTTSLAISLAASLEMDYSHPDDLKKLTRGRIAIHQTVENLIKSAHMDTTDFIKQTEQTVGKLSRARSEFLGLSKNSIDGAQYKKILKENLFDFLGGQKLREEGKKDLERELADLIEMISESEVKNSKKIAAEVRTPLDLAQHKWDNQNINHLASVLKHGSMNDMVEESGLLNLRKASGQLYRGLDDVIVDTLKNNKGLILGGLGALAGVAMMGRSEPTFNDSRQNAPMHNTKMLMAPQSNYENTTMGMETNPTKANYITPHNFGTGKSVRVEGDFVRDVEQSYNEFSSLIDPDNIQENMSNISNSIFGDGIRSARLLSN